MKELQMAMASLSPGASGTKLESIADSAAPTARAPSHQPHAREASPRLLVRDQVGGPPVSPLSPYDAGTVWRFWHQFNMQEANPTVPVTNAELGVDSTQPQAHRRSV